MMLSVPLTTVNAIEYEVEIYTEITVPENRLPVSNGTSNAIEQYLGSKCDEFKEYLRQKLINCEDEIDISSYNVPYSEANMNAVANFIGGEFPEAFHVNNSIGFSYSTKIHSIFLKYNYTKSQYTKMYNEIETTASEILSGISGNYTLSEAQKALLIHDRIAVLCEYDTSTGIPSNSLSYTMYGALVKEVAVCQGYAEAYKYLLEKVGIESYLCSSEEMKHAWNIVKIDGKYYHVDVTWDDPTQDITGRVKHTYFLLSTKSLKTVNNGDHNANDFDTTPVSTVYDDYFWDNSDTEFQLIGNNLYYIDNNDEYLKTYSGVKLCSVNDTWYTGNGGYYWTGNYSRLSSDGKDLLFTETDAVYRYSLKSGKTEKVFTPENSYGRGYNIYGFKYDDGKLICEIRNTPNQTNNVYIESGSYSSAPVTYTVSYNANGGSVTPESEEATGGSSVTLPVPTRSGYIFLGWSKNKSAGSPEYEQGDSITVTEDITLYAVWEEEKPEFIVKSFETVANDDSVTTVEIFKEGSEVALYKFEIGSSGEQKLALSEIEKGNYIVVISKKNHVAKTCEVTIDSEHLGFDLQINPVGDGTGDGRVNAIDVARANASAKGVSPVYGYEMDCYDINGDHKINAIDVARINGHAKGVKSLW